MKILVTAASKHGSTREIARAIGEGLSARGLDVDVLEPRDVVDVAAYDAVVIGSAVYMGRWMGDAVTFVNTFATSLRGRPVWLFSSGPLDRPSDDTPEQIPALVAATNARGHRVFAGKLERAAIGPAARTLMRLMHVSYGDFRDWKAVDTWTTGMAEELGNPAAAHP